MAGGNVDNSPLVTGVEMLIVGQDSSWTRIAGLQDFRARVFLATINNRIYRTGK